MLGVRGTSGLSRPQHPVQVAVLFPRIPGIPLAVRHHLVVLEMRLMLRSSPHLCFLEEEMAFPGGDRMWVVRFQLITLNTPALSVTHFFSSFSFCPQISWNRAEHRQWGSCISSRSQGRHDDSCFGSRAKDLVTLRNLTPEMPPPTFLQPRVYKREPQASLGLYCGPN